MRGVDQIDFMTALLSPRSGNFNHDQLFNYICFPRRSIKIVRALALTSCILFCYLLLSSVGVQSDWDYVEPENATVSISLTPAADQQTGNQKGSAETPLYYTIHTNEVYDIEAAIRNILQLAPDEVYTQALTEPITSGGEEKLRELGLRVRLFKKYFEAWEALHVLTDARSNTAFARDDVMRYLRDTPDISSMTDKSRPEAMRAYENYRTFLSDMSGILFPWTAPYFSDHMTLHGHMYNAGRGIVISGSDAQAPYILTAISSFRQLGCDLPVEIMYLGDYDLSQDMRERLEAISGVATRDLKQMVNDEGWELEGWAGKAFAAFMSSFREVILLDADVLFFNNPEELFLEPEYLDTGALFFRDRVVWSQEKRSFLRKILPKPISAKAMESRWWKGESGENQESGVVVVDKWRHFLSVFLTARLNGPDRADSETGKGTYSFWLGDKETWWIGFELAGDTDYHFHRGDVGNMGVIANIESINTPVDKMKMASSGNVATDGESKMDVLDIVMVRRRQNTEAPVVNYAEEHAVDDSHVEESTSIKQEGNAEAQPGEQIPQPSNDQTSALPLNNLLRRDLQRRDWFSDSVSPHDPPNPSTLLTLQNTNYILCSPQLLHLSMSNRPLWFNGWIQQNKHQPSSAVSKFEFFMTEKRKNGDWADWAIGANNMCCVKGDGLMAFEESEKDVLDMIVDIAKDNGALSLAEDAKVKGAV